MSSAELLKNLLRAVLVARLFSGAFAVKLEEYTNLQWCNCRFFNYSSISDSSCSFSNYIPGSSPLQRTKKDCIKRGSRDQLASTQVDYLLFPWSSSWYGWWVAWSWWRFHFRSTFSWNGNPTSGAVLKFPHRAHQFNTLFSLHFKLTSSPISCKGFKCHSHLCNDIFCFHVCGRILPSKTFPSSLW